MATLTQDYFNHLTSQMTAAHISLQTAMVGLVGSNAQSMRSAADSCSNVGAPKSQSLLPTELRAAKAIDSTVGDLHRGGLPSTQPGSRGTHRLASRPTCSLGARRHLKTGGRSAHEVSSYTLGSMSCVRARGKPKSGFPMAPPHKAEAKNEPAVRRSLR